MKRYHFLLATLLFIYTVNTLADPNKPFLFFGTSQLAQEINELIRMHEDNADIAVYVKSMRSGQILYNRNIYHTLTPASTLKVLTAEAALLYLGPNYRFTTQVRTNAKAVKASVLQGNLYVVLSGDPSLTYDDLTELLQSLKNQSISAILGNVYIDHTAYDQRFYGPGWGAKDKQNCYGAPISASIINRNCLALKIMPARVGKIAKVISTPNTIYPAIKNRVITKQKRTRTCSVRLTPLSQNKVALHGCLNKGHIAHGLNYVISNIPEYNRALFKDLLHKMGIKVYGKVTFGNAPKHSSLIGLHQSDPLKSLINEMLKKSDNVIAGALFKKLGQVYTHQPGSWENGSIAVAQILARQANLSLKGLRILDGSGLSPNNLLTPAQMMQVLDFAYHNYATSYEFVSALPIAGIDGTLKNRLGNVARRVRAKTGTISGVISLAGYTVTAENEPVAFVIMINGSRNLAWQYRAMEDRIVTALTRYKHY